jgi:uncharacterized protein YgiM (DUF1202 family)
MKKHNIRNLATFLSLMVVLNLWACIPKKSLHISQGSPPQIESAPRTADMDSQTVKSPLKATAVVESEALNLRAGPSIESAVLSVLKKETRVTILNSHQKWVEVTTQEGRIGWVFSDYLSDFKTSNGQEVRAGNHRDTPTLGAAPPPEPAPPKPESLSAAGTTRPDQETQPPPDAPVTIAAKKSDGAVETVSDAAAASVNAPQEERDDVVFADPQGHFEVRYPVEWRESHGLQYDVEQFRLQSPSTKMEFWILNTQKTDGYTLPQFYTDMVAPLKQLYGEDIEIRPLKEGEALGAGWLQGHVALRSGDQATYDYVMTEKAGRFWVIMEIQRPGAPRGETEALGAIKNTFSFSAKN